MAQGNQPQKRNLAAEAFRRNYDALHDALVQPDVASGLATKLYSGAIIAVETRDAVQMPSLIPTLQANLLLRAVESSIKINHTRLRKFTRVLRKQPVLKPLAKQLRQCYSELVSEARLTESSSSGSDTDSTEQHQSQAAKFPTASAVTHTASPGLRGTGGVIAIAVVVASGSMVCVIATIVGFKVYQDRNGKYNIKSRPYDEEVKFDFEPVNPGSRIDTEEDNMSIYELLVPTAATDHESDMVSQDDAALPIEDDRAFICKLRLQEK